MIPDDIRSRNAQEVLANNIILRPQYGEGKLTGRWSSALWCYDPYGKYSPLNQELEFSEWFPTRAEAQSKAEGQRQYFMLRQNINILVRDRADKQNQPYGLVWHILYEKFGINKTIEDMSLVELASFYRFIQGE